MSCHVHTVAFTVTYANIILNVGRFQHRYTHQFIRAPKQRRYIKRYSEYDEYRGNKWECKDAVESWRETWHMRFGFQHIGDRRDSTLRAPADVTKERMSSARNDFKCIPTSLAVVLETTQVKFWVLRTFTFSVEFLHSLVWVAMDILWSRTYRTQLAATFQSWYQGTGNDNGNGAAPKFIRNRNKGKWK
ncbi:hypothetical protein F5141DRAFT_1060164 [Pisolithus sp. B1]|nr:hypothetical protein F5141DRAFT_1060164 [Pisolithus sp. B1]